MLVSNTNEGHKLTYELVISFYFSLGSSEVFFTACPFTKNCESWEFISISWADLKKWKTVPLSHFFISSNF